MVAGPVKTNYWFCQELMIIICNVIESFGSAYWGTVTEADGNDSKKSVEAQFLRSGEGGWCSLETEKVCF